MQFRIRHLFPLSMALGVGLIACKRDTTGTTSTTSGAPGASAENAAPAPEAVPGREAPSKPEAAPKRGAAKGHEGAPGHEVAPAPEAAPGHGAAPSPGAIPTHHDKEIQRLATARCAQAQRCNGIGHGRKFATEDACLTEMRSQGLSDVYQRQCPGSIDDQRLEKCISAIKTATCSGTMDPLDRISECGVSSLCPSMSPR